MNNTNSNATRVRHVNVGISAIFCATCSGYDLASDDCVGYYNPKLNGGAFPPSVERMPEFATCRYFEIDTAAMTITLYTDISDDDCVPFWVGNLGVTVVSVNATNTGD